jgi:hypothetical protein
MRLRTFMVLAAGAAVAGGCTSLVGLPDVGQLVDGGPDANGQRKTDATIDGSGSGTGTKDGAADAKGDATLADSAPDVVALPDGTLVLDAGCSSGSECASGACCSGACVDETTDVRNCGACGTSCDSCTTGRCLQTLATGGVGMTYALTVDSTHVYWLNYPRFAAGAGVARVPLAGGATTTLATIDGGSPFDIAVTANGVYWTDESLLTVERCPLDGGSIATLYSGADVFLAPQGIAVTDAGIYWSTNDGHVLRSALDGGNVVTLSQPPPQPEAYYGLAISGDTIYVTTSGGIGPDGGQLQGLGGVSSLPLDGGPLTVFAGGQQSAIGDPQLGGGSLVFVGNAPGAQTSGIVVSVTVQSDFGSTIASGQPYYPAATVDATNIYWSVATAATPAFVDILTVPIAGGSATTLVAGTPPPTFMAVDGTSLYWTDSTSVKRVTPKK